MIERQTKIIGCVWSLAQPKGDIVRQVERAQRARCRRHRCDGFARRIDEARRLTIWSAKKIRV